MRSLATISSRCRIGLRLQLVHLADLPAGDQGQVGEGAVTWPMLPTRAIGRSARGRSPIVEPREDLVGVARVVASSRRSRRGPAPARARRRRAARAGGCPRPRRAGRAPGRPGRPRRGRSPASTSASSTRWENSAPWVSSRFARMRSASTVMPSHERDRTVLEVVEQDRRVGQDRRARRRSGRCRARATGRRSRGRLSRCRAARARARDLLALDRVALVRHRRGALLPGAERLLDLAHLGALQVADLGREALEAGAGERDRAEQLGVAVARHDLRGDVLAREPQARQHAAPRTRGWWRRRCRRRRRRRRRPTWRRPLQALRRCGRPRRRSRPA